MTEEEKYAIEWEKSANDFEKQELYKQLAERLSSYPIIFEIGCGTGQSTLSLLENGHGVIAVEQNEECLFKAIDRIKKTKYSIKDTAVNLKQGEVYFIKGDITDCDFINNLLNTIEIGIVICWNIGTYWDIKRERNIVNLLQMWGFKNEYIFANPESAYAELIHLCACQIAKVKSCPLHIVDRGFKTISENSDIYYNGLKNEFGFAKISYNNIKASTLSQNGRKMISDGKVIEQNDIDITIYSILIE